jgi:hypothetical protein
MSSLNLHEKAKHGGYPPRQHMNLLGTFVLIVAIVAAIARAHARKLRLGFNTGFGFALDRKCGQYKITFNKKASPVPIDRKEKDKRGRHVQE